MKKMFMHLTNYAVNKNNPNFVQPSSESSEKVAHKRTLKSTMEHLEAEGHDVEGLRSRIADLVIKTLCMV
jgi:tubulin polyglutamylase TTLL6/13